MHSLVPSKVQSVARMIYDIIIPLLISSDCPFLNSTFLWSFKKPVLISGPLVSRAMATGLSLRCLKASLSLPTVSPWSLWSPWEKLSRATFMPASIIWMRVGTSQQAGPMVHTIFVDRFLQSVSPMMWSSERFVNALCCIYFSIRFISKQSQPEQFILLFLMHQPITYQSQISLSLTQFSSLYLYSDGFMMSEFQLESFHMLHGNLFHDFHNTLFRIIPVINYKWTQQIIQEIVEPEFSKLQTEPLVKERKNIVTTLSSNIDGEVVSNISLCEKLKGTPLIFGSSNFHLIHLASLKFLCLNDTNPEDIHFELVDFPNEGCILKFTACLQYQKMRTNMVHSGDAVVLSAMKAVCNRFPNLCSTYLGIHYQNKQDDSFQREVQTSRVLASIEDVTRWRVNAFHAASTHEKGSEDYLQVGDVVALYLSEKQLYLNALKPYDPQKRMTHLMNHISKEARQEQEQQQGVGGSRTQIGKRRKKVGDVSKLGDMSKLEASTHHQDRVIQQKNEIDDVKELKNIVIDDQVLAFEDVIGQHRILHSIPSSCYWRLESDVFNEGGKVSWDRLYRIRHFQTGRYLSLERESPDSQSMKVNASLISEANNTTLFRFVAIQNAEQKEDRFLQKDSFFYLYHVQSQHFLGITEEDDLVSERIKHTMHELGVNLKQGNFSTVQGHFNTYRMKRIEYGDAWETSLLLYSLPTFLEGIEFINKIQNQSNKKLLSNGSVDTEDIMAKIYFYRIYKKIFSMLEKYEQFVDNKLISHISHNQEYGMTVPQRQNLNLNYYAQQIRNQTVQALLVWLLFRAFPNKKIMSKYAESTYNSLLIDFSDEKEFMIKVQSFLQNKTLEQHQRVFNQLEEHHEKRKMLLSFKLYMTLNSICRNNRKNEEVFMNFLNIVEDHIGYGDEVSDSLIQSFTQNYKILQHLSHIHVYVEKKVTLYKKANQTNQTNNEQSISAIQKQDVGQEVVQLEKTNFIIGLIQKLLNFAPYTKPNLLKFLASICAYKEVPLYVNQDLIIRNLIKNSQLSRHSLMTINLVNGKDLELTYIHEDEQEKRRMNLQDFLDDTTQNGHLTYQKQYAYLYTQLQLYANLCLNRNLEAGSIFKEIFSLNVLKGYVMQERLGVEIRAVFLKLIRTLYVDQDPYSILRKPELVIVLDYDPQILIPKAKVDNRWFMRIGRALGVIKKKDEYSIRVQGPKEEVSPTKVQSEIVKKQPQLLQSEVIAIAKTPQSELLKTPNDNAPLLNKGGISSGTSGISSILTPQNDLADMVQQEKQEKEQRQFQFFLSSFRNELLHHLEKTYHDLNDLRAPSYKIYTALTYEIIRILHVILKFGLFISKEAKPKNLAQPHQPKKTQKMFTENYTQQLLKFEAKLKESDMEKFINYLAALLEYDEQYFKAIENVSLKRKYQEQRRIKEELIQKQRNGLGLTNLMTGMTFMNMFTTKQEEKKSVVTQSANTMDADVISDPLFKKIKGLKKILTKCSNKTYTFREDSREMDYERTIKIEICEIFSYLLDIRQDQYIENAIGYFKNHYVKEVVNDTFQAGDFISLLPENQLAVGEDFETMRRQVDYSEQFALIRNFDTILERPFYEILIMALYFSSDSELQSHLVDLIQRFSQQKKEFLDNIKHLQLLIEPNLIHFYRHWNNMINQIKKGVSHSQAWLQLDTPAEQNFQNEEKLKLNKRILLNFLRDFQMNDQAVLKVKQNIFVHVGGYDQMITLMTHCLSNIDNHPKVFKFSDTEDNELHYQQELGKENLEVLKIVLEILKMFFKNDYENQLKVHQEVVQKLTHYSHSNFNQVQFIVELFCEFPKLVEKITFKHELKFFIKLIKYHGMYYEFLEFYFVILSNMKQQDLDENPELVKNILKLLIDYKHDEKINPMLDTAEQIQEFVDLNYTGFFPHKPTLDPYRDKYLQVVAKCLKIDVGVNLINRAQQVLTMHSLMEYLLKKQRIKPKNAVENFEKLQVRQSIIEIITVLIERTIVALEDFLAKQNRLQEYIRLEKEDMDQKTQYTYQQQDFLFFKQMPLLLHYFKAFNSDKGQALFTSKQQQKQDGKMILDFAESFMNATKHIPIGDMDQMKMLVVEKVVKVCRIEMPNHLSRHDEDENYNDPRRVQGTQQGKRRDSEQSDVHCQFDPITSEMHHDDDESVQQQEDPQEKGIKNLLLKFIRKKKHQGFSEITENQSDSMNKHWKIFVSLLSESQDVHKEVKKELFTFSQSIWKVNEMFQDDTKQDQKDLLLSSEDLLNKLLYFIEYWKQNYAQKKNVVFVLKVLVRILQSDEDDLLQRQAVFNKLSATKILIKLVQTESESEQDYLNHLLKLFTSLLHGGNKDVQKIFFEYVNNNSESEKFFYKLNSIIAQFTLASQNQAKVQSKLSIKIVNRALRSVQLLCEGHNNDLQNYLHHQANSKNSYDLPLTVVRLLTSLKIDNSNFETIMQCFDTLTDTLQGPCYNNQVTLTNSKFMEYAIQILSEDERIFQIQKSNHKNVESKLVNVLLSANSKKTEGAQKLLVQHPDHQKGRGTLLNAEQPYRITLHPGKLARIKYKVMVCILAILECNDPSNNLILRIVRSIPLKIMTANLARVFMLYRKYEKDEYEEKLFKRQEIDLDLTKDDDYYELIIETGFFIYFLIQTFLSNKKGAEILYEDVEMREILDLFEEKQEDKGLLDGGIIGSLFSLVKSITKSSLGAISKMKEGIDNALKNDEERKKEEELKKKAEQKEQLTESINFFKNNSGKIEIIRFERIYTIYFPLLPLCHLLPKDLKNEFHDDVNRATPKSKITFLMSQKEPIVNTMKHEETLKQFFKYNPLLGFIVNNGKLWENFAFLTTIIINFVVCLSYSQYFMDEVDIEEDDPTYPKVLREKRLYDPRMFFLREAKSFTKDAITIIGLVELVFSSMIVGTFVIKRAPLKIYNIWQGFFQIKAGFFKWIFIIIKKCIVSFFTLLQDFDILYYSLYILAGIVGLIVHPFLFCIHLMDFLKLDQLKTVVKAMWVPRVELGLAFLLMFIVEYYFSIMGYMIFYNHYEDYFAEEGAVKNCSEFWRCYIITYDWTFKYTGALGANLKDPETLQLEGLKSNDDYDNVSEKLPGNFYVRFFFDNIFNIILVMILLNMIQGIIIDTFGSLREELADKLNDQAYICFICGIDMEKLDKSSDSDKGFKFHIKKEHYMWNYVFYRAYIDFKDETEFDGNETYIRDQIDNADISWFPIGKAKCVADDENEDALKEQTMIKIKNDNKQLNEEIIEIHKKMEGLIENIKLMD